jgi:hypothetical protein
MQKNSAAIISVQATMLAAFYEQLFVPSSRGMQACRYETHI